MVQEKRTTGINLVVFTCKAMSCSDEHSIVHDVETRTHDCHVIGAVALENWEDGINGRRHDSRGLGGDSQ